MKLLIIPIGRTHDQYDNAKYYQRNFGDIFLDQRDPEFQSKLIQSLNKLSKFKKKLSKKNKKSDIIKAKELISQSIFSS